MSIVTKYVVIKNGGNLELPVYISEINGKSAANVEVNFSIVNSNNDPVAVGTLSSLALTKGSFVSPTWIVGTLLSETASLILNIEITDDSIQYFKLIGTATTTTTETAVTNNIGEWEFIGIDISTGLVEKAFEVPTSAFEQDYAPTLEEVETWVDDNLTAVDKLNGTLLTYNPNPLAETLTFQGIGLVIDGATPASLSTLIVNGTEYPIGLLTTNSATFSEAAFQIVVESALNSEGLTGTVTVTDDIDGSGNITLNIASQTGIYSIGVIDDLGVYTSLHRLVSVASNYGRKYPLYMWQLNSNGVDYTISEIYRGTIHARKVYVDPTYGNDDTGEIGDPLRPFKNLEYALAVKSNVGNTLVINLENNQVLDLSYQDLTGRTLMINANTKSATPIITLAKANGAFAQTEPGTKVIIGGTLVSDAATALIQASNDITDSIIILDSGAVLLNDGTADVVSNISSAPSLEVVVRYGVSSNSLVLDANIAEVGSAILRNSNIR